MAGCAVDAPPLGPASDVLGLFSMGTGAGSTLGSMLFLLLPLALLAFLMLSQRRRQREIGALQAGLQVGEEVLTTSGLFGRIVSLDETAVTLDAGNGVLLRFDRRAIATKTPPSSAAATPADAPKE